MSAQTIAGCTLAALFAVFWLAYGAVRLWESRNASYTASEWLEAMRKLPPLPPPRRTQEGDPEVCGFGRMPADLVSQIEQIGKGRG